MSDFDADECCVRVDWQHEFFRSSEQSQRDSNKQRIQRLKREIEMLSSDSSEDDFPRSNAVALHHTLPQKHLLSRKTTVCTQMPVLKQHVEVRDAIQPIQSPICVQYDQRAHVDNQKGTEHSRHT